MGSMSSADSGGVASSFFPRPSRHSKASEEICKLKLRPTWSLSRWHEKELHQRAWPEPLPDVQDCPQRLHHSGEANGRYIFDASQPAVLQGVLEIWPDRNCWNLNSLLHSYGDCEFVVGATL